MTACARDRRSQPAATKLASRTMLVPPSAGVVVVTSAARAHPSTEIIWTVLHSLSLLGGGLSRAPIRIVCDGCRGQSDLDPEHAARLEQRLARDPCRFSKRGIVTDRIKTAYTEFKARLADEIGRASRCGSLPSVSMLELEEHHGFALAVREGLRAARSDGARLALVVQHDRAFCRRMPAADVDACVDFILRGRHPCRCVGFPSGTSKLLASRMSREYKLDGLLDARSVRLRRGLCLRPSIFWCARPTSNMRFRHPRRTEICVFTDSWRTLAGTTPIISSTWSERCRSTSRFDTRRRRCMRASVRSTATHTVHHAAGLFPLQWTEDVRC